MYALSRSQKDEYPENVVHSHVDLLDSAEDMARNLHGIEGEYVFFAAYLQQQSEDKEWEINGEGRKLREEM